jgi:uncharacterized membrane protein YfcA
MLGSVSMSAAPSLWILIGTGAATGLVGALLGLGGGVFLVPLLTLALGLPIRVAIAASLISVIATASAAATVNLNRGVVNMRLGMVLEVATTVGGLLGGLTSVLLSQTQLFGVFGATLAAMAVLMVRRSGQRNVIADVAADPGRLGGRMEEGGRTYVYRVRRLPVGLLASFAAGAISGLLGIGGGIIKVPVLNTFCGIPIRVAASTSAFMIGVTAAASAFVYYGRGTVDLHVSAAVALGTLPGSLAGARLSEHMQARSLKMLMAGILVLVAARMLLRAL